MNTVSGLSGLLLLILSATGHAQNLNPRFGDTVTFSTGILFHNVDAGFGATLDDNPAVDLSLNDLGVGDDETVFWSELSWAISPRWHWDLTYNAFDGDGFIEARTRGNFGEIEFDAGASLTSNLDVDVFITDINYNFLRTNRGLLGAGIGFHVTSVDFGLLAAVDVATEGGQFEQSVQSQTVDVLAPLPTLSITGGYRIFDKVYASADVGYLSLNVDKYDGGIFSVRTQVEWRPWEHVGIGAGYQFIDLDLDVDRGRVEERYDLELVGPKVFLSFGF